MKNSRFNKGYTLVELIITLAVIGVMIVPIFDTFLTSNRVNLISKRESSSAFVAQKTMEELKAMTQAELDQIISTPALQTRVVNGANTNFNVDINIVDTTASLGITLDTTSLTTAVNRNADITISLPSSGGLGSVTFNNDPQTDIITDVDTNLIFEVNDSSGLQLFFRDSGRRMNFVPQVGSLVTLDVEGPSNGTPITWSLEFVNLTSNNVLDIQKVNDENDLIQLSVKGDEYSTSDVLIGNSIPTLPGQPSTPKKWYNIVITVSFDATVYETIESTIGK